MKNMVNGMILCDDYNEISLENDFEIMISNLRIKTQV